MRASRRAGLAPVADAGERGDALLDEVVGRAHVHDLGRAGIADRARAAHEEIVCSSMPSAGIVDPMVVILRPVEHHGLALEGVGIVRVVTR